MRSTNGGVTLVRQYLQKSLVRAQNRYNLSNPQSATKEKVLKQRIKERKLQNKLNRLQEERRLLFGETDEIDWRKIISGELADIEFVPAEDSYQDYIESIKSKCTVLSEPFKSTNEDSNTNSRAKKIKKGVSKKLKKLRKLLKKEREKAKLFRTSDENNNDKIQLIPNSQPKSKLELLREQRLKIRKLKKQLKKEAKKRQVELEKQKSLLQETKKLNKKSKKKKMKDVTMTASNGDIEIHPSETNSSQSSTSSSSSSSSTQNGETTITAKLHLISNVNGVITPKVNGIIKAEPQLPKPKHVLYDRSRIKIGWKSRQLPGVGFYNMGNTCYMNATLQALFHVPSFAQWLQQDNEHKQKCHNAQKYHQCIVCAMASTLKESQTHSSPFRPMQIYSKIRSVSRNFVPGRQEDAHEFLRHLLEAMEISYLRAADATNYDARSKETNPLGQIFGGYLRTEVSCLKCQHVSTTFQPLAELQLDIRLSNSVEDAINHHFKREKVDNNDYRCEGCKMIAPVIKQFSLEVPPIALCLQLKRFTVHGGKIGKYVQCNPIINLTQYQHKSLQARNGGRELRYRLVSMITHLGSSPHGGHYTARGEASNGKMYQFDDSYVGCPPNNGYSLDSDAYVILYEMVSDDDGSKGLVKPSSTVSPSNNCSVAAAIRDSCNAINGFSKKPSTITSASLKSSPIPNPFAVKSKLVTNNLPTKTLGNTNQVSQKPTLSVSPSFKIFKNENQSPPKQPTTNGNSSNGLVKPANERPIVSFKFGNSSTKSPNVNSPYFSTLRPTPTPSPPSEAEEEHRTPPKMTNGVVKSPKSLVPYDNMDDSEESTPERSREGSLTPNASTEKQKFNSLLLNAPIKNWNGTPSTLTKSEDLNRKRHLEKTDTDLYNEAIDSAKMKKRKDSQSPSKDQISIGNRFQYYEDTRRIVNERTKALQTSPTKCYYSPNSNSGSSSGSSGNSSSNSQRSHHQRTNGESHYPKNHITNQSSKQSKSHSDYDRDTNYICRKGYNPNQGNNRHNNNSSGSFNSNRFHQSQRSHHHNNGGNMRWKGKHKHFKRNNNYNNNNGYHRS